MMPEQYKNIVDSIRKEYTTSPPESTNYKELSISIQRTIRNIALTQKHFDFKHRCEESTIGALLYDKASQLAYRVTRNPVYGTWSNLFGLQLEHVRDLNKDLATLIRGAEQHMSIFGKQMVETIDAAAKNAERLSLVKESVTPLEERYTQLQQELAVLPNRSTQYEQLKENITQEHTLLEALNEIALVSSVQEKENEKIEFLRRHVLFHRGTIHSAKRLAVATQQICDTLQYLKGVYESIQPIGTCLQGIHEGLGILKGYTDDLHNVYAATFKTITNIEQQGTHFAVIRESTDRLNPLVSKILETLHHERN
jgi:hypothetical protein